MKTNYIIPIFVPDLGCPFRCCYCNQVKITGQQQVPGAQQVEQTVLQYLGKIPQRGGIKKEIAFYGGSFTVVPRQQQEQLLKPAFKFKQMGLVDEIRISTRPDYISRDILQHLKKFGVSVIELGVQSLNSEVLDFADRGYQPSVVGEAAELIRQMGFALGLQMMIGLPKDTPERALQTARQMIEMGPDFVRIYPTLVIDNTPLADLYAQGGYRPLDLVEAVEISKNLLLLFKQHNVAVIRIGLQPTEDICAGKVLDGPFHPAFRELVEAELAGDLLLQVIGETEKAMIDTGAGHARKVRWALASGDQSVFRGQKCSNLKRLQQRWPGLEAEFVVDNKIQRGQAVLLSYNEVVIDRQCTVCDVNLSGGR